MKRPLNTLKRSKNQLSIIIFHVAGLYPPPTYLLAIQESLIVQQMASTTEKALVTPISIRAIKRSTPHKLDPVNWARAVRWLGLESEGGGYCLCKYSRSKEGC